MRVVILLSIVASANATLALLSAISDTISVVGIGFAVHEMVGWGGRSETTTPNMPPVFSGEGEYWSARKSANPEYLTCSGRIAFEVPKYITGTIAYNGNEFEKGRQRWTVRAGRQSKVQNDYVADYKKNGGASGSYKRVRYVRGSKDSSCLNGDYPEGELPPSCSYFNLFESGVLSFFGTRGNTGCTDPNELYAPRSKPGPGPELHSGQAGNYNPNINYGFGHPMCDDEHKGYESVSQYPCISGLCDKRPQENVMSVYFDETHGLDEEEDSDRPDHWMLLALGTQGYKIDFRGTGTTYNMANDHERLIPSNGGENSNKKIQLKRIPYKVWNFRGVDNVAYAQNIYPNSTSSINFWDKIIGQAHRNNRGYRYDEWWQPVSEGGGGGEQYINWKEDNGRYPTQSERDSDTDFCRREPGNIIHRSSFNRLSVEEYRRYDVENVDNAKRRLLFACREHDGQAQLDRSGTISFLRGRRRDSRGTWFDSIDGTGEPRFLVNYDFGGTQKYIASCREAALEFDATSRDFCLENAPGWAGSFNRNPQQNEFVPTEAYSDYEGCPEDATEWWFYVCLEDVEGDCENRPLNDDHVVKWTAFLEPPSANPVRVDQMQNGTFPSYPLVLPFDKDPYPNEYGYSFNNQYSDVVNFNCFSGSDDTFYLSVLDRNSNQNPQNCSYFDQRFEGSVIQSTPPYMDSARVHTFNLIENDGTNGGSIIPPTVLLESEVPSPLAMNGFKQLFPAAGVDLAEACCGLGGGSVDSKAPTVVPPPPTPPPPRCYDKMGVFRSDPWGVDNTDVFFDQYLLEPETGCAGLRNVYTSNSTDGIVEGMAIHQYICPEGGEYKGSQIDCTPDKAQFCKGDGLIAKDDCCICGGGSYDRDTPHTYSPTTVAPTGSPTVCLDSFKITVPFFPDVMHQRNSYTGKTVIRNPITDKVSGEDYLDYGADYYRIMRSSDGDPFPRDELDYVNPSQGICDGKYASRGDLCNEMFPLAYYDHSLRMKPYWNEYTTSLIERGYDFYGVNATFVRQPQTINRRPYWEVLDQTDALHRHVVAWFGDRWAIAKSKEHVEDREYIAWSTGVDGCIEDSTWIVQSHVEHTYSRRDHIARSTAEFVAWVERYRPENEQTRVFLNRSLYWVVRQEIVNLEWPIEFEPVIGIAPGLPDECPDIFQIEAPELGDGRLWQGLLQGAVGVYRKLTKTRFGKPMWALSGFDDPSNWHIYFRAEVGWVLDNDANEVNGFGSGAILLENVSCPTDRGSEAWRVPLLEAESSQTNLEELPALSFVEGNKTCPENTTVVKTVVKTETEEDTDLVMALSIVVGVLAVGLIMAITFSRKIASFFEKNISSNANFSILENIF